MTIAVATGLAGAALVFTDTAMATQRAALERQWAPVDLLLRAEPGGAGFDPAAVDRLRAVPGVRAADGISAAAAIIAGRHVAVHTLPASPELRGLEPVAGREPARPGEAVIDAESAREHGWAIGTTLRIADGPAGEQHVTVVGTVDSTGLRRPDTGYVAILAAPGPVTEVVVAIDSGADPAAVLRDAREVAGPGVTAQTRDQLVHAGLVSQDWHELTPGLVLVLLLTLGVGGGLAIWLARQARGSSPWGLVGAAAAGVVGLGGAVAAVALLEPQPLTRAARTWMVSRSRRIPRASCWPADLRWRCWRAFRCSAASPTASPRRRPRGRVHS